MPIESVPLANEFISRFGAGGSIDHMKLHKLMYFTNGWWLGLSGKPLLTERPQVWRYGPVFRNVYGAFSKFGNGSINTLSAENPFGGAPVLISGEERERTKRMIDWIWGEYGGRTAIDLSEATHAPGTPWRQIAASYKYSVPYGTEIHPKLDWEFFSKEAAARGWIPAPYQGPA